MQMNYLRLAEGLKDQKSTLIPITTNIYDIIKKNPTKDYYTSLYTYEDHHLEHFKKNNSVAGIKDVKTRRILFDFDDKNNIEAARKDALEVCARLIKKGTTEDSIRVFFSGGKGFNVELITDQQFTRQEFVNVVFNLAGDLPTFDTRINDEARIIRAPLTKHPVSGLYKIPLSVSDLATASMEDISSWAIDPTSFDVQALKDDLWVTSLPKTVNELRYKTYKKVEPSTESAEIKGFNVNDIDFSKCPKWLSKERFALMEGYFYGSDSVDQGERNIAFMILAATFRGQGFSADHSLALLSATAEKQAKRTGEKPYTDEQLKREIINPVFSTTWKGGIYGKDEPLLILTRKRFNLVEEELDKGNAENISDVAEGFKSFAKELNKNRILTGLKSFDDSIVLTKGMLLTVVSAPGGGKSALGNMFAENVSKSTENVLYFSLDLYKNLLFARQLQRHVPYDIKKIFEQFESDDIDENLLNAYSEVLDSYSNVSFIFNNVTIDDIENEIKLNIEKKGKSPNLVIVDYLDKVRTQYSDPTQSSAHVASRLSDFAKKYNTLVLLMAQPSKHGSQGPNEPFKSYRSLKGSSSIESDSRVIIGIHRDGYNPQDMSNDKFSTLTILKNNTGVLGRLDYAWDGLKGTFTELNYEQKLELKQLREENEARDALKKSDWDI